MQDSLPIKAPNSCNIQMVTDIKMAGRSCHKAKWDMAHVVSCCCFISFAIACFDGLPVLWTADISSDAKLVYTITDCLFSFNGPLQEVCLQC